MGIYTLFLSWEATLVDISLFTHPWEATLVDISLCTHLPGGYPGGIYPLYTLEGYPGGIYLLYAPREATLVVYVPSYTPGRLPWWYMYPGCW